MNAWDVIIVGGGIVGLATARNLTAAGRVKLLVIEAEMDIAPHQTSHNSGVIHSGLYYKPGSLKARNCSAGREEMYRFCQEHGIAHERCGKLVVAVERNELAPLDELERRGQANGLEGMKRLGADEIPQYEPHIRGLAGLWVPQTGIVDYLDVARTYKKHIEQQGGAVRTSAQLLRCQRAGTDLALETTQGPLLCRHLINCSGLQCDRVARLCGVDPGVQILPFRGEYYEVVPERRHLVKNLIYPVPDPRFPFLGVHFTRTVSGMVEAGPNAVLAWKREGYSRWSFSPRDTLQLLGYPGFWRMAWKYTRMGLSEMHRSFSKKAFLRPLQRLMPELQDADIRPAGSGVRAQAVEPSGALVDDFRIVEAERMIHVLNAPSPAATASLSIGQTLADKARTNFAL